MPRKRGEHTPSYRHHKASGQALVTIDGRGFYLGEYGTPDSRTAYDRIIAEWLANGRRLPATADDLTINELVLRYWRHAEAYYRKNGAATDELYGIRAAMRPLKRLYGSSPTRESGPLNLKAVRQVMIDDGHSRKYINGNVNRIKRMFKWAVANELVSPSVYHGLQAVEGLKRGRCEAREAEPVRPVPEEYVQAVLPHVSRRVATMIKLQLATGMRPGEVTIMRTIDIDTTGKLWKYVPFTHKTEHYSKRREVYLGPKAQAIVRPFLRPNLEEFLFSPAEAEAERNAGRRQNRKTPMTPSQDKRKPTAIRRRPPRHRYTVASYRRAIARGCDTADKEAREKLSEGALDNRVIPHWHPNQLRHNFATRMRKEFGLEVTRVVLGHASVATSEIYAERDSQLAARIVAKIG